MAGFLLSLVLILVAAAAPAAANDTAQTGLSAALKQAAKWHPAMGKESWSVSSARDFDRAKSGTLLIRLSGER